MVLLLLVLSLCSVACLFYGVACCCLGLVVVGCWCCVLLVVGWLVRLVGWFGWSVGRLVGWLVVIGVVGVVVVGGGVCCLCCCR